MDIHEIYQEDNKFEGEESIYYVLVGKGDSSRWDKSHKYYIITRSAVAIYDINAASMVKKIKVMTWPIPGTRVTSIILLHVLLLQSMI